MEISVNQAVAAHQEGRLKEAEHLYRSILETQPTNLTINNNLGVLLSSLGRFDEAEAIHRKVLELEPDYVSTHNNLGNTLKKLGRFDEAEASYRKALELEPDYVEAHNNLGAVLQDLGKFYEAEASYIKAIELKSDYVEAHNNLELLLTQKRLLSKIEQAKKSKNTTEISFIKKVRTKLFNSDLRLTSNTFISNRKVEKELISQLYKINTKKLNDVNPNIIPCYGIGRNSDYKLFENNFAIIKTVEKDLINIMKETVKSDIFIVESFFNIFQTGSGIIPHNHLNSFDDITGLFNQKFSLAYYLDTGDQNCSEPGTLKLQDPDKEILPSEGMITIFPSDKMHSATYGGKKDRVMIGVNFYSLI